MVPLITRSTRFTDNSSSLIDNIFTNKPDDTSIAGILILLLAFFVNKNEPFELSHSLNGMPILHIFLYVSHSNTGWFNKLQTCSFIYKSLNGLLPAAFHDIFTINMEGHEHNTRQKPEIHIISHRIVARR